MDGELERLVVTPRRRCLAAESFVSSTQPSPRRDQDLRRELSALEAVG
jgi:hypothetical protein